MEIAADGTDRNDKRRRLYLLYHELRPSGSAYSYVTETAAFERHLDLNVEVRARCDDSLWPAITFDDGHVSNYEFALPRLAKRRLRAHFFITAGWTGRRVGYMDWEQIRALHDAGQMIGAHGWTHTLLTHCDAGQLQTELDAARKTLEDHLGSAITTMSLPGGRYNARVIAACLEAGYTRVFSSVPQAVSKMPGTMVGRLNIRGDMSVDWLSGLLAADSAVLAKLERQYKMKAAVQAVLGDRLYAKLWAVLNRQESETVAGGEAAE